MALAVAAAFGCQGAPRVPMKVVNAPALTEESIDISIARVISHLARPVVLEGRPTQRFALRERMEQFHVPGVSVAVVHDGKLAWARGFGIRRAGKPDLVTGTTLFQAASITKAIAATAALRLVDEGIASLDENVNSYLRTWTLPDNEFTLNEKVTLRRIMTHTAGTSVHGFLSTPFGQSRPTLLDLLEGHPPASNEPVRVMDEPGRRFRYSGGGALLEQLALMDVTGCGYEDLIAERVLIPAQMTHSVVEQPLSETRAKDAAAAHDGQGLTYAGLYPVNPVVAGLWTTPTDLLRWASAITAAAQGEMPALLSRPLAIGMITRARDDAPTGLGTFVDGSGDGSHFGHGGRNEGYISEVIYFPNRRQGAAVMLNGDAGHSLLQSLLYAIADEYGWPGYSAPEVEMQAPATALIDELVGTYVSRDLPAIRVELSRQGNRLFADCTKLGVASEAVQHGPDTFFTIEDYVWFDAMRSVDGTVDALQFAGERVDRIRSEHRNQIQ